jgi:hypothetical protein
VGGAGGAGGYDGESRDPALCCAIHRSLITPRSLTRLERREYRKVPRMETRTEMPMTIHKAGIGGSCPIGAANATLRFGPALS